MTQADLDEAVEMGRLVRWPDGYLRLPGDEPYEPVEASSEPDEADLKERGT